ncbi:hypothetical protein FIBSPDRAFT_945041 [Athelia psychrophila]|uniref:Uncharacterized protein n=1 Tax=Athelia psychrophila TaxID=1759441 RepID=A0A166UB65_9AGAM|nr:hypothetical protein FIBSPDRAFT_945041 [Fibularhizoctonia sp. CBS 109695]
MSFMCHIHRTLGSLGPGKGRAIAFVIGCGLGVLMCTLFVLTVQGGNTSDEEAAYREIISVTDANRTALTELGFEDLTKGVEDDKDFFVKKAAPNTL